MPRITRAAIVAVGVASLVFAGTAAGAQEATRQNPYEVAGQVQVSGSGSVALEGRFVAFGLIARRSTLRLVDRAGDAKVMFNGRQVPISRRGRQARVSGMGRFYLSGTAVLVEIRGKGLLVNASGLGTIRVKGRGTCSKDGAPPTNWDDSPVEVGSVAGGGNNGGEDRTAPPSPDPVPAPAPAPDPSVPPATSGTSSIGVLAPWFTTR